MVGHWGGDLFVPHTNIMKTRNMKSVQRPRHSGSLRDGRVTLTREVAAGVSISMPAAAAFTIITQPALLTDFSEAAAPAPDGVTVWGGRMADGTLNRFGAESAGGIEAEVD